MATAKKAASKSGAPAKKAAPAAKKTARAGTASDAVALLTQDHADVKKLFKSFERLTKADAGGDEKQDVVQQICMMLTVHAQIEEEIFYPAMREGIDAQDELDEAEVEHASCKELIAQLEGMQPEDDLYDAKVTVLGEYVDHHVQEEEGEMFPKAKKAKLDLVALGAQLSARKEELLGETESSPA